MTETESTDLSKFRHHIVEAKTCALVRSHLSALTICLVLAVTPVIIGIFTVSARAEITEINQQQWQVKPKFHNRKARNSLSGAICAGDALKNKWCLAVNDEKLFAQFFAIKNKTLKPKKTINLLPQKLGSVRNKEIDAEAVAYYDGFVYVAASHGLSRKASKLRPSQFFVFRFPVNKTTGKPTFDIKKKIVPAQVKRTSRLRNLIRANPITGPYAEQPLKRNGVTLEGMAVTASGIHFGFRTPSINGKAVVITAPASALFGSQAIKTTTTTLNLGTGQGIRDMAVTDNGILILSGPSQKIDGSANVFLWQPDNAKLINYGKLPLAPDDKAETLLLLNQTKAGKRPQFNVLVLFDGQKNGSPRQYRLK